MLRLFLMLFISILLQACSSNNSDPDLPENNSTTNVHLDIVLDASAQVLTKFGTTLDFDGSSIGLAQAGTVNGYASQGVLVTLANGEVSFLQTTANASADAIASQFSLIEGIEASANTQATISIAAFINTSGTMIVSLNGTNFQPVGASTITQLADLGTKINASELFDIIAYISPATGDLQIKHKFGADLVFGYSGAAGDNFNIEASNSITLHSGQAQGTIGGTIKLDMGDGISLANGSATSPLIANFRGSPFVNNQFSPSDSGTYNDATSLTIYDSLGMPHVLSTYFAKQPSSTSNPNTWLMHVLIDNEDVADPLIGSTPERASFNLVFNVDGSFNTTLSDDVLISNWVPLDEDGEPNGAAMPLNVVDGGQLPIAYPPTSSNFEIDFNGRQLGSSFRVFELSQNGMSDTSSTSIETGQFTNIPVKGLSYITPTESGITNTQGKFTYRRAETIEFFIGGLSIGKDKAESLMDPFTMSQSYTHLESAKNIFRLLLSLDNDGDVSNGVDISAAVEKDTENKLATLDLNKSAATFGSSNEEQLLLGNLTNASTFLSLEETLSALFENNKLLSGFRTTGVELSAMLGSNNALPSSPFSPDEMNSFNHVTHIEIFDSLSLAHDLALYFVNQGPLPTDNEMSTWLMHAQIDQANIGDPLIGTTPTLASYRLVFNANGSLNPEESEEILVSNWVSLDSEGEPNGAAGPLNVVAGGQLPIASPPTSSNFEIVLDLFLLESDFRVMSAYQNGIEYTP